MHSKSYITWGRFELTDIHIASELNMFVGAGGHTNGRVLQSDVSPSRQVEQLIDDLAIGTFIWVYSRY